VVPLQKRQRCCRAFLLVGIRQHFWHPSGAKFFVMEVLCYDFVDHRSRRNWKLFVQFRKCESPVFLNFCIHTFPQIIRGQRRASTSFLIMHICPTFINPSVTEEILIPHIYSIAQVCTRYRGRH
jgi:hypothetical protein